MSEIDFTWDDKKNSTNKSKHGISFEEASSAFSDENARLKHDQQHSYNEDRFILLGFSSRLRILIVCHVYRTDETEIRIISARKATKNERKQYGSFL